MHIVGKVKARCIIGMVQPLMDEGHRLHPVLTVLEHLNGLCILHMSGLQVQETGNDLQVIFDAMMHFFQQDILHGEPRVDQRLLGTLFFPL